MYLKTVSNKVRAVPVWGNHPNIVADAGMGQFADVPEDSVKHNAC